MKGLFGRYVKPLDAKNRFITPNVLRKKLEGEDLILVCWFDQCIALFPESEFDNIADGIDKLQEFNRDHRFTRRQLFSSAFSVEFDKQGRLTIPDHLLEHAELNNNEKAREVVLIGDYDKIEIWEKGRFENFVSKTMDGENVNKGYENALTKIAEMTQGASKKAAETSQEREDNS